MSPDVSSTPNPAQNNSINNLSSSVAEQDPKHYLVEIFSAIQGEGPIVGTRQIFIRYLGCHIQCAYCDTPATHTKQRKCRVERSPGKRDFEALPNPLTTTQLTEIIQKLEAFDGLHDGISLTGGEPLMHIKSLKSLIPILSPRFPIYLETDGILHQNLASIVDQLDLIGMDMKLPSSTLLQPYWEEHAKFLPIAARREVFVKLVIAENTSQAELDQAIDIIVSVDREIPLILQPVTPYGVIRKTPSPEQMLALQSQAKKRLKQVRVIPQTHKIMGQI